MIKSNLNIEGFFENAKVNIEILAAIYYNVFIGHPEANKKAIELLKPEELECNIFIDNPLVEEGTYYLVQNEDLKIALLKNKGLI